jgi:hypothetical protein
MTAVARKLPAPTRAKARHTSIALCRGWRVIADAHQWTLQTTTGTRRNRRTSKPETSWRTMGYHASLESALKHFNELRLRLSGAQDFAELLRVQTETHALIEKALSHDANL